VRRGVTSSRGNGECGGFFRAGEEGPRQIKGTSGMADFSRRGRGGLLGKELMFRRDRGNFSEKAECF